MTLVTNSVLSGIFFDTKVYEDEVVRWINVSAPDGRDTFEKSEFPIQMTAEVAPSYAANKEVSWKVEPLEVLGDGAASITDDGLLTIEDPGVYVITAEAQDGTGRAGHLHGQHDPRRRRRVDGGHGNWAETGSERMVRMGMY